jgi:hypothetical protein
MRFGLFYEIQVPRPVSPVPEAERLREVVAQVRYAEEMGFDRVWFVEHHFLTEWAHCSASEVMLAVMSQHTTRMRLGFGVVLLPVHHPLHVAAKVATLDVMSGGRVDVGVGRSGNPYQLTPFGVKLVPMPDQPEDKLTILDAGFAAQKVTEQDVLVESDKLINQQWDRTYITAVTDFAIIYEKARVVVQSDWT